ncbi:MAG: hypothetical protein JWM92_213 [Candidatus Nomurabacteria bacterium]|nr:hypothetical protein [Candidatus Nomurabacteria bacterium]
MKRRIMIFSLCPQKEQAKYQSSAKKVLLVQPLNVLYFVFGQTGPRQIETAWKEKKKPEEVIFDNFTDQQLHEATKLLTARYPERAFSFYTIGNNRVANIFPILSLSDLLGLKPTVVGEREKELVAA